MKKKLIAILCMGIFVCGVKAQESKESNDSTPVARINSVATKLNSGEGKFLSKETDNQEDLKKVLFFMALKDLVSKELKNIGADANQFWKKFEEKYDNSMADDKKGFYSKKEEEYKNDSPKDRKEKIDREWLFHNINTKTEFMGLSNVLNTYSITRLNRSPQNPLLRYMTIQGEVGKQILGQLYRKLTQEGPVKDFSRVFLFTKFDLVNCTWNELGVDSESDFTKVVKSHWLDWLKNQLKGEIDQFELADEGVVRDIDDEVKEMEEKSAEKKWEMVQNNDWTGNYNDSILIKINVIIKKVSDDSLNQTRSIEIKTDYLVKAIGSNIVATAEDISIPRKEYSVKDNQNYSSALATAVYQSPLVSMDGLKRTLQSISPSYRVIKLEIGNANSLLDLARIQEFLENLNPGRQVRSSIVSQIGKEAVLEVKINGNKDEISRYLNSLDNAKVLEGKVLLVKNKARPFMLELKDTNGR